MSVNPKKIKLGLMVLMLLGFQGLEISCAENFVTYRSGKTLEEYFPEGKARELAKASANGDIAKIDALVSEGTQVDFEGVDGLTPLLWATGAQSIAGVRKLLELGANPNRVFDQTRTAMSMSIYLGNLQLYEILLKHKADPNFRSAKSQSALAYTIYGHSIDFLRLSFQYGGKPDSNPEFGTELEKAILFSYFDMAILLMQHGANPTITPKVKREIEDLIDGFKMSGRNDPDFLTCVKMLRDRGVEIN